MSEEKKDIFDNLESFVITGEPLNLSDVNKSEEKKEEKEEKKDGEEDKKQEEIDLLKSYNETLKEKEEKEEKEGKEGKEGSVEEDTNEEAQSYKDWATFFKEQGLLENLEVDKLKGTPEELIEALKQERESHVEAVLEDYKSQLPKVIKDLIDNYEENVPLEDLIKIKSEEIKYNALKAEDLEDKEELQKSIYRNFLKDTTKFSDAKIEKLILEKLDLGTLQDEAKESLEELKKIQVDKERLLKENAVKETQRRKEESMRTLQLYEKTAKETKELIPSIKLSDKDKQELLDITFNGIAEDETGRKVSLSQFVRSKDPVKFDLTINHLLSITKGFTDFSKLSKSFESVANQKLEKVITPAAPKGTPGTVKKNSTKDTIISALQEKYNNGN